MTRRPLMIHRADGHLALANSAALEAAGIRSDEEGVERDVAGAPTGRITKDAVERLGRWASASLDDHAIQELQLQAAALGAANGVTSAHEMSMPHWLGLRDLQVFLGHRERLPMDVEPVVATTDIPQIMDLGLPSIGGDLPDGRLDRSPDRGGHGAVRRRAGGRHHLSRRRRARGVLPRRPYGRTAGGRACHRGSRDRAGHHRVGAGLRGTRLARASAFPRAPTSHRALRDGQRRAGRAGGDARSGGIGAADVRSLLGRAGWAVRHRSRMGTSGDDESVPHDDRSRDRGRRGIGQSDHAVRPGAVDRGV